MLSNFNKKVVFVIIFINLNFSFINSEKHEVIPIEMIMNKLLEKVQSYQVVEERKFKPPFNWAKNLGLFKSEIRMNLYGMEFLRDFRDSDLSSVFDNDMFSTGWILTALLEANLYGKGAPITDQNRLILALEAIGKFNNKNDENARYSLVRTFWSQVFDEKSQFWYQEPINIRNVALDLAKFPFRSIACVLKLLKLKELGKIFEEIANETYGFADVFHIPPDFDDTYLNLGLGSTLSKVSDIYPTAIASWLANNTNVDHLIEITEKYSYDPFNDDLNKNLIDPRTFFYARKFIQEAGTKNDSIKLITTW